MPLKVRPVPPMEALPALSTLYGTSPEAFRQVTESLTSLCIADDDGELLGVLGLRLPTHCGSEVMGGALPGENRHCVAVALLQNALKREPHLVAYGEEEFFPENALQAAGFSVISAHTKMTGPLPTGQIELPAGYRLVPLDEVQEIHDRLLAQEAYLDQPGHTVATLDAVVPNAYGSDDRLGFLAYAAGGPPVGVVRVWLEDGELSLGNPGVHHAHRGTGLRQSLLLAACAAARQRGATRLVVQSWGETEADRRADQELGLQLETSVPIYGTRR